MAKHFRTGVLAGAALVCAGCSSPEEMGEAVGAPVAAAAQSGEASSTPPPAPEAPEPPAKTARAFVMDDAERDGEAERVFTYNWPREASAIPALAAMLGAKRDASLAEQKEQWADAREACPPNAGACARNQLEIGWQVVTDIERFLSLSSNVYSYSGGAHGNYWRTSLVWDREAKAALDPEALFVSAEALEAAISEPACEALNQERAKRRGQPVPSNASEWPDACPPIADTVIFLGSASGTDFDRVGVYYAPYVAGAYAEGDFELTLPVTGAVLGAVKPEYRDAFANPQ